MRLEDAMRQMSGELQLARESTGKALSVSRSVEALTAIRAIEPQASRQLQNRRMRTRMSGGVGEELWENRALIFSSFELASRVFLQNHECSNTL